MHISDLEGIQEIMIDTQQANHSKPFNLQRLFKIAFQNLTYAFILIILNFLHINAILFIFSFFMCSNFAQ